MGHARRPGRRPLLLARPADSRAPRHPQDRHRHRRDGPVGELLRARRVPAHQRRVTEHLASPPHAAGHRAGRPVRDSHDRADPRPACRPRVGDPVRQGRVRGAVPRRLPLLLPHGRAAARPCRAGRLHRGDRRLRQRDRPLQRQVRHELRALRAHGRGRGGHRGEDRRDHGHGRGAGRPGVEDTSPVGAASIGRRGAGRPRAGEPGALSRRPSVSTPGCAPRPRSACGRWPASTRRRLPRRRSRAPGR